MALRSFSATQLRAELARRERGAVRLLARHEKLAKRLAAIESDLDDLGVDGQPARRGRKPGRPKGRKGKARRGRPKGSKNRGPGRPRGRSKNKLSLAEAVTKVVPAGKTVSPAEVLTAVRRVYKSSSKNLGMMVANTLAKHPEFKRVGRGQYIRSGGRRAAKRAGKAKRRAGRKAGKARRTARRKPGPKAARPAASAAAASP